MKFRFLILAVSFFIVNLLPAQNTPKDIKEAKKLMEKADNFLSAFIPNYDEALKLFLEAGKLDTENPLLNFNIGVCYLNTIGKVKAITYLEKALKKNPEVNAELHYLLGKAYHLNYEFDKAIAEYKLYKESLKPDDAEGKEVVRYIASLISDERPKENAPTIVVSNIEKIIDKRIKECNTGKELVQKPVKVTIENIGAPVNSSFPDYGPVISADESVMYFTARRDNTTGGGRDQIDTKFFEDIYVSYNVNGKWSEPKNIGIPISTNDHESVKGLSADGQTLFMYNDVNHDGGDIYECKLKGDKWSPPVRFPNGINSSYGEKSLCLSADEQTIYFVSNKTGGLGGRDIYTAKRKGTSWGTASNLGNVVNTEWDEDGVFFHPDGRTLYFSSKGHTSMGGYDIFKTTWNDTTKQWSKPENMGYPINTPDDDIYFVLSASGERGYYASVRNDGLGEKDIYVVHMKSNIRLTLLKGVIRDAVTKEPLEADIQVVDVSKNVVIADLKSNSKTGKYLVTLPSGKNYGIAVSKEGYLFHSENFDIPATKEDYQEVNKDVDLNKVAVGTKIILKNIFYDFDKATLTSESMNELERLLKVMTDYPNLVIEISSHTDDKGSDDYNKKLSEARARSVVDYLVSKGIAKDRLKSVGYGESKPIALNKNPDGSDNPEGRQMNRRTEFLILKN